MQMQMQAQVSTSLSLSLWILYLSLSLCLCLSLYNQHLKTVYTHFISTHTHHHNLPFHLLPSDHHTSLTLLIIPSPPSPVTIAMPRGSPLLSSAKFLCMRNAYKGSARGRNPFGFTNSFLRDYAGVNESKEASDKGHGILAPFTAGQQMTENKPLVIERSEGVYVFDSNGKKYLDSLAGLWCTSLGGNEPRLINAALNQMKSLPFYHSFWNRITKPSLELSKELINLFTPSKMSKVFFTNDGSESNDTQVKLVWYYNNALGRPKKKKIIARHKSYHGSTLVAASLTGLSNLHHSFDLPVPFVLHTDCPHYWRFHNPGETEEQFASRLASNLEELIIKEGPENIAAFIAEPVMGAGGVIPPPPTYFEKVQAVLKKHDILFIADEVICAFGRLGTMFGCEKYDIRPDLVTVAKALSSGYLPIGAVLMSSHVAEVISSQSDVVGSFAHGFTYSGHPVPCAVALEALKIYQERKIVDYVRELSPFFQEGMREAISDSPIVGEVRGTGLIMGVEFTKNKSPTDLFPASWATGTFFGNQCADQGMLVRVSGDTIMMSPPLISTKDEIKELVTIFRDSVRRTENFIAEQESKA